MNELKVKKLSKLRSEMVGGFKSFTSLFAALIFPIVAHCESLDFMRSTGKIYVVVAVIIVIFLGITFYLNHLDKKLKNLEDKNRINGK